MSNQNNDYTGQELTEFFHDTSALVAAEQSAALGKISSSVMSIPAAQIAGKLVDKVEFWKSLEPYYRNMLGEQFIQSVGTYNIGNISGVMGKAGAIGVAVGVTFEALTQYRRYKSGELSGVRTVFASITASKPNTKVS